LKHNAFILSIALLALSCNRTEPATIDGGNNNTTNQKHNVILCATGAGDDISIAESKTIIGSDGKSVYWADDDLLALWAEGGGSLELDAEPFKIYGVSGARAFFTAELGAPMSAPSYTYYAASPLPLAGSAWPHIQFAIPQNQDGSGQGIMISAPTDGAPLRSVEETLEGETVQLRLEQQLHLLKFWLSDPSNLLGGEAVQRIKLFFPQTVTGTYEKNITEPGEAGTLEDGSYYLTMDLATPLAKTGATERHYAMATIFPRKWSTLDEISGKIYTETKIATLTNIPLSGRNMAAGHTTAVRMNPDALVNRCKVYVNLASNPLGEDLESVTLTAPSGCKWGDNLGNVYTWYTGQDIPVGSVLELEYEEESAFRTLSGKSISITFDSEHVQTSQSISVPNLNGKYSATLNLNVPPLLDENFASVGTFSSNDNYSSTFNSGSKDAYSFLSGWTGGRIGASAGKCIRIACRRETSARYPARVDSAPLTGTLKKTCKLNVAFSYGSNNKYGGIAIITDGNVGQTCYVGYVTNSKGYKSGDTDGTYTSENSFYTKEYTGSWTNTPNETDYTIPNVPAGTLIRISWRTEAEDQAGTTNTTCWLYLDNIKVTIEK
jgi:hypothetical protein